MRKMSYKTHEPERKENWSNGFIAFAAHPPIPRKTPCYLVGIEGCHDKEHIGWRPECGAGFHEWLLNYYRSHGPNHYHCMFCGIAKEIRYITGVNWGPRVSRDWIDRLKPNA